MHQQNIDFISNRSSTSNLFPKKEEEGNLELQNFPPLLQVVWGGSFLILTPKAYQRIPCTCLMHNLSGDFLNELLGYFYQPWTVNIIGIYCLQHFLSNRGRYVIFIYSSFTAIEDVAFSGKDMDIFFPLLPQSCTKRLGEETCRARK